MPASINIRSAAPDDAAALLDIYRYYVESTAISFELQTPDTHEFAARVQRALDGWAWLVAEANGRIVGYAYGGAHRAREAYRYSVETSAYVHRDHHRAGIARALYLTLLARLHERGFVHAYAGITLPNDASVCLHRHLGFAPIGVFPKVGFKFDNWHDVAWLHRPVAMPAQNMDV